MNRDRTAGGDIDLILAALEGGAGTIILNHPARRNSICDKLAGELVAAFDSLERDGAPTGIAFHSSTW